MPIIFTAKLSVGGLTLLVQFSLKTIKSNDAQPRQDMFYLEWLFQVFLSENASFWSCTVVTSVVCMWSEVVSLALFWWHILCSSCLGHWGICHITIFFLFSFSSPFHRCVWDTHFRNVYYCFSISSHELVLGNELFRLLLQIIANRTLSFHQIFLNDEESECSWKDCL